MTRCAKIERQTKETNISVELDLDGTGKVECTSGIGFFDHMIDAFGRHGLLDLNVQVQGDLNVDGHHSVEDAGIVLGCALARALADKRGINRFGTAFVPMDEALVMASLDFSGRGQLHWDVQLPFGMVGDFDTQLAREFFVALASNAGITLHVRQLAGENAHHIIEAAFKACGRAICQAVAINPRTAGELPTTKGLL
jgi:imidazoleglycerol-phosphate dehydratase